MRKRELYEQHSRDKGGQRRRITMNGQGALCPALFINYYFQEEKTMALDIDNIKDKAEDLLDKIPDDVKDKAKELATKENLEKAKDTVTGFFKKDKDDEEKKED